MDIMPVSSRWPLFPRLLWTFCVYFLVYASRLHLGYRPRSGLLGYKVLTWPRIPSSLAPMTPAKPSPLCSIPRTLICHELPASRPSAMPGMPLLLLFPLLSSLWSPAQSSTSQAAWQPVSPASLHASSGPREEIFNAKPHSTVPWCWDFKTFSRLSQAQICIPKTEGKCYWAWTGPGFHFLQPLGN